MKLILKKAELSPPNMELTPESPWWKTVLSSERQRDRKQIINRQQALKVWEAAEVVDFVWKRKQQK